jgi:hypothetical protein
MEPELSRTGIPRVDALIDVHRAEQAKVDAIIERNVAAGAVARPRQVELVAAEARARWRIATARGLLTKARNRGDADKIAAAERRLEHAEAEYGRVSDQCLKELFAISHAGHDRTAELLAQLKPAWDAGSAVIEALARPPEDGRFGLCAEVRGDEG